MRPFDILLLSVAFACSLFGLLAAIDFVQAAGAQPCLAGRIKADCYPWGAEGPAADSWRYSSKAAYLISSGATVLLSFGALVLALLRMKSMTNVVRVIAWGAIALVILIVRS